MQQIWIQVRIFFGNKFEPHAFKINVWRVARNIFLIYGNEMPNDPNLTGRDFLSHIIKCKMNWQVSRQFNCSSWCLFTYEGSNCFSTMENVQSQANCKPVPLIWKVFELGDRALSEMLGSWHKWRRGYLTYRLWVLLFWDLISLTLPRPWAFSFCNLISTAVVFCHNYSQYEYHQDCFAVSVFKHAAQDGSVNVFLGIAVQDGSISIHATIYYEILFFYQKF